jgi:GNAT superfamily N-acetyltransferase
LKEVYFKNLTEKNKEESTSEYYGNIDEKAQLIVKVYRIKATNYDGEMVYQYYFVDRDGNKFYTYSIKNADTYKEGDILEVKGTIKQHREIVGIKYTYLNRLKVLRVIQEPEMLFKDGGQIGQSIDFSSDEYSTIIYHEKEGNWFFPKDGVYVWLYDDPKAGDKLRSDEYDYILFPPQPPMSVAFQKNYVPPLLRIWTKDYQKKTKGSDKLIGIVKAFYEESENKLYIDMMTTRKEWRRQGVNSYLVNFLRKYFKLDKDDVVFVDTTKEGEAFQKSGKYAEGGEIGSKYVHKHIPNMTFEITDFTTKGVKGIQKHSKSLSKKERIEGKVVFYSKAELKDLWQLEDSYAEGGEVELLQVGQTLRLRRVPIFYHPGYVEAGREVTKKVKKITYKDVRNNGSKIITEYHFWTTDKKSLTAIFRDNELAEVYNENVRYESA